jgi:ABC-type transport system involved in multi-copper enzyme maturation permease subunit
LTPSSSSTESPFANKWRELVTENPMTIEISRFRRRFLEGGRGKTVNTMVMIVAILAYMSLLLVIATMSGTFPPVGLIYLQTGLFAIISPALMFSAISGEREKRSWDLLLVAPISNGQIIVGKFLAALAGIFVALILLLLPTIFTALTYRGAFNYGGPVSDSATIGGTQAFIMEELISVTYAMFVAAMTLFFSARCRRSLMALGIVLGINFCGLIAFPALYAGLSRGAMDFVSLVHPIFAIGRLEELQQYSGYRSGDDWLGAEWYGLPQIAIYLAFTIFFIVWAWKTVNFADSEKKFMPRKTHA